MTFWLRAYDLTTGAYVEDLTDIVKATLGFNFSALGGGAKVQYSSTGIGSSFLRNDLELRLVCDDVEVQDGSWITQGIDSDKIGAQGVEGAVTIAARHLTDVYRKVLVVPDVLTTNEVSFTNATAGVILRTVLNLAATRGAWGATALDYSTFSFATDTNGVAWTQTVSVSFKMGVTVLSVMQWLLDRGLATFRTVGRNLRMYNADSIGVHSGYVLAAGDSIKELPSRKSTEQRVSHLYVQGDEGKYVVRNNALPRREEGFISQSGTTDAGTLSVIGDNLLQTLGIEQDQRVVKIARGWATRPTRDFTTGDWVILDDGEITTEMRVRSLAVELDPLGADYSAVLNDRILEASIRRALHLQNITNGITIGTVSDANPAPTTASTLAPAQVTGGGAASTAYLDSVGNSQAVVSLSWSQTATNSDGSAASDIDHYEVWSSLGAAGALPGNLVTTTTSASAVNASISPYVANTTYRFSIRAIDRNGNAGAFSAPISITTVADAIPPPTPSTPTVVSRLGTATVSWDGLTDTGGAMPPDFSYLEVHRSVTNAFAGTTTATMVGALTAKDSVVFTDQTYGTAYYFRFRAVDRSGNKSVALSVQVTNTVTPLVSTDLIGKVISGTNIVDVSIASAAIAADAITTIKIAAGAVIAGKLAVDSVTTGVIAAQAVTTTLIADNAITTPKIVAGAVVAGSIAAGAITAVKIQAGAITAEKLSIGSTGEDLLVNGSFEDVDSSGNALPLAWNVNSAGQYAGSTFSTTTAKQASGARSLRIVTVPTTGLAEVYSNPLIPVQPGEVLSGNWSVAADSPVTAGGSLLTYWYNADSTTRSNLAIDPSMDAVSGTAVTRTNIMPNPTAQNDLVSWNNYTGSNGVSAITRQSGQTGWASNIVSSVRNTWSTAGTLIDGGMLFDTINPGVTPGRTYCGVAQIRCSKAQKMNAYMQWYTSANAFIGNASTPGATVTLVAGVAATVETGATVAPATAAWGRMVVTSTTGGTVWAVGDYLEVTNGHIEETRLVLNASGGGGSMQGAFTGSFGATAYGPDYTYTWAGTVNASASQQRAPALSAYTPNVATFTLTRSTEQASQGSGSMKIGWPFAAANNVGDGIVVSGLSVGQTYTYSRDVWVPNGSPAVVLSIDSTATSLDSTINNTWQRLTVTFVATLTLHTFRVIARAASQRGDYCYTDAMQIEAGAVATPFIIGNSPEAFAAITTVDLTTTFTPQSMVVTVPNGAAYARVGFQTRPPAAGIPAYLDKVTLNRAIVSANIGDGAITTPKLVAGAVTAVKIAANSITAEKLTIGSVGPSLVPNGGFEDASVAGAVAAGWAVSGGTATRTTVDFHSGVASLRTGASGSPSCISDFIPAAAGDVFSYSVWAKGLTLPTGLYIRLSWRSITTAEIAISDPLNNTQVTGVWTQYTGTVATAPAGTVGFYLQIYNTTGDCYVDDLDIRRVVISAQIADGAIVTAKIAALAVTAGTIAANAITSDKITAGAVTTVALAAQAVTAAKVAADAIVANNIVVGSVDYLRLAAGNDNLIPNPTQVDVAYQAKYPASAPMSYGTTAMGYGTGQSGGAFILFNPAAGNTAISEFPVGAKTPVTPGDKYFARMWSKKWTTTTANYQASLGFWYHNAAGAVMGFSDIGLTTNTLDAPQTWLQLQGVFVIQSAMFYITPVVRYVYTSGVPLERWLISDLEFRKVFSTSTGAGSIEISPFGIIAKDGSANETVRIDTYGNITVSGRVTAKNASGVGIYMAPDANGGKAGMQFMNGTADGGQGSLLIGNGANGNPIGSVIIGSGETTLNSTGRTNLELNKDGSLKLMQQFGAYSGYGFSKDAGNQISLFGKVVQDPKSAFLANYVTLGSNLTAGMFYDKAIVAYPWPTPSGDTRIVVCTPSSESGGHNDLTIYTATSSQFQVNLRFNTGDAGGQNAAKFHYIAIWKA